MRNIEYFCEVLKSFQLLYYWIIIHLLLVYIILYLLFLLYSSLISILNDINTRYIYFSYFLNCIQYFYPLLKNKSI